MINQKYIRLGSFLTLFFCLASRFWAQPDTSEMVLGSGNTERKVPSPTEVIASDGKYFNGVVITWKAIGPDYDYWVERSASPNFKKTENVTERWISNNSCYDKLGFYAPRYYYRVKARYQGYVSKNSASDVGFPKPIASDRDSSLTNTEQNTPILDSAPNFSVLGLSHTERTVGEPFFISYAVENTTPIPLSKIEVKFYLSENEQFDAADVLLNTKMIDLIDAKSTLRDTVQVTASSVMNLGFIIMVLGDSTNIFTTKKISIK